jgi:hypothetical protein
MTSAVLTLKIISTGRSKNPARASTDVSTVLGPSLCIVLDNERLQPGFRRANRTPCAVDPGDRTPGSTSRLLALAALLSRLVLAAAVLTTLVATAALLLATLTRLLLARLLLATLVGIVCLVHVLLLLPPE